MDAELRELLEVVASHGPATRPDLRELFASRNGLFSGRALAEAIRRGLVSPSAETVDDVDIDPESWQWPEEAYVLTRAGAIALEDGPR